MKNNLEIKVAEIVEKISKKKVSNINVKGSLKDELALDSIQIVELFAALENEFNIELPLKLMTVRNAEEFMEILKQTISEKK